MKKLFIVAAALLIAALVVPAKAQESVLPPNANKTLIEDNLFVGLKTDNPGLQRSCALLLGRIKSGRAVIPLMEALHRNSDENVRIATAWALCKIGDERGVYAVKMSAQFDESSKVQAVCAWYYENFVKAGTFMFIQPEIPMAAIVE
jgi:HEAT repeat protein